MQQSNKVWYQVNPHYFRELALKLGWVEANDTGSFFQLLHRKLDYIKALGCDGLWLMPLYERGLAKRKGFGSPYAVKDYQVSEEWGSEAELKQLIEAAHSIDMAVIGEYVPNHLAPDAPFLQSEEGLYYLNAYNEPLYDQNWTDTVKLNHSHPSVQAFTSTNLKWLSRLYGFDGFRLDMAHYPMYDADKPSRFGQGQPDFWQEVLADPDLKNKLWIGEVYDDRSKEYGGYYDAKRLIEAGVIPYDKQTHDLIAYKLKSQTSSCLVQERLFEQLYLQAQIAHATEIDLKKGFYPFLRLPSNHDDCPMRKNFGGREQANFAFEFMSYLPGELMLYAGEEYALHDKPSVIGLTQYDEEGRLSELAGIELSAHQHERDLAHQTIRKALGFRQQISSLKKGSLLVSKVQDQNGMLSHNLCAFWRFLPEEKELILIVANFNAPPLNASNNQDLKSWGMISEFYQTFDFPAYTFSLQELLEWVLPEALKKGFQLVNLKTQKRLNKHKPDEPLWVGVHPLEVQIFRVVPAGLN